ncbi:MAG: hypothetical protein PUF72_00265 [Clostridiales bacterium]|nr:hypothetical protein [Clostridiales bacterium]
MKYKAILADEDEIRERTGLKLGPRTKKTLFVLLFILLFNLLAVLFTRLSREVYYWDNAIGYNMAAEIAGGGVSPLWKSVYDSIINQSFNYLSALPSALFMRLFGASHTVYILSLVNCSLLPSYGLIYRLAKKIGKAPAITWGITIFMLPMPVYLTLNGFSEIGGFVMCLGCFCLYYGKAKWWKGIAMGALLALMTLWNSWYIFFAVSFLTAMAADLIVLKKPWYIPVITLCTMAALLARFFEGFVLSQLVSVFGQGNLDFRVRDNLHMLTRYFGLLLLLFVIIDSIVIFIKKKERGMIFAWVQAAVCYLIFTAARLHGQGHMLMYAPAVIVLLTLCIRYISKERLLAAVLILALLQTINIFLPWKQPGSIEEIKRPALVNSFSLRPQKRDDIGELLSLKSMLDERVAQGEYLGVLAYSDAMNDELLRNLEPSLNIKPSRGDYIARTIPYFDSPQLDISPLCNASYILAAYPLQTVSPNQMIVETALESFSLYSDIAAAYEEQFDAETTINGVTYKLYRRVRKVTPVEKAEFLRRYNAYLADSVNN